MFPSYPSMLQEAINMRYVGVTEADYEWITDQIMQVANRWVKDRNSNKNCLAIRITASLGIGLHCFDL